MKKLFNIALIAFAIYMVGGVLYYAVKDYIDTKAENQLFEQLNVVDVSPYVEMIHDFGIYKRALRRSSLSRSIRISKDYFIKDISVTYIGSHTATQKVLLFDRSMNVVGIFDYLESDITRYLKANKSIISENKGIITLPKGTGVITLSDNLTARLVDIDDLDDIEKTIYFNNEKNKYHAYDENRSSIANVYVDEDVIFRVDNDKCESGYYLNSPYRYYTYGIVNEQIATIHKEIDLLENPLIKRSAIKCDDQSRPPHKLTFVMDLARAFSASVYPYDHDLIRVLSRSDVLSRLAAQKNILQGHHGPLHIMFYKNNILDFGGQYKYAAFIDSNINTCNVLILGELANNKDRYMFLRMDLCKLKEKIEQNKIKTHIKGSNKI